MEVLCDRVPIAVSVEDRPLPWFPVLLPRPASPKARCLVMILRIIGRTAAR